MGRTNPTFRDALAQLRREWRPYRRGLRRTDQPAYDDLMGKAEAHADAAGYANPADPTPLALLSMLLEQQTEIDRLRERLDGVEDRLGNCVGQEQNVSGQRWADEQDAVDEFLR